MQPLMARHYAKGADLTKKMTAVAKKFGREVNRRRTKVSNPQRKVSNLSMAAEGEAKNPMRLRELLVGAQGLEPWTR